MEKIKTIIKGITFAVLTNLSFSAFAADVKPQAEPKVNIKRTPEEKIGSWYYQCETIEVDGKDKQKTCGLLQNFFMLDKDKKPKMVLLSLQILKLNKKDKKITFIGIRTPLGTDLVSNVKMQIADKDYKVAPFETCLPNVGCSASFVVEGELEAALKASKLLKITYKTIEGQLISLDVKTEGYTKAIAKF